jgi:hypothetical protein
VDALAIDGAVQKTVDEGSNDACAVQHVPMRAANIRDAAIEARDLALKENDGDLDPFFMMDPWSARMAFRRGRGAFRHGRALELTAYCLLIAARRVPRDR